tara:strand:+ start:683 stop:1783 length:1101 start_codon:yes stop_codon:yes gene_type:complete
MLKKILIFYPSFENGGATKNLINIVNYLLQKGIKVILLSHNAKKKEFNLSKNLKVINSKPLKKFFILPLRWNLALSSMISLFLFAKSNYNNSIIFSMQSHIPAIIVAKLIKKKIIIRNSEEPIGATIYADNKILASFILVLKFIFYNFADKIIAISKKSEESLNRILLFNNKIILISNPYINKVLSIKRKRNKIFSILSVGRFTHQKNLFPIINAFSNLLKKNDKIKLNIVGGGNLKMNLIDKIKNKKNIKIINWKKNLKNNFLKSDLFVLNSLYEGLPNVLLDAVNYEIPCISSNVSGAKDILINGKGGYIIPINNPYHLERKIEYVMSNYSEAQRKAKHAKSKIQKFGKINLQIFYNEFEKLTR